MFFFSVRLIQLRAPAPIVLRPPTPSAKKLTNEAQSRIFSEIASAKKIKTDLSAGTYYNTRVLDDINPVIFLGSVAPLIFLDANPRKF